MIRRRTGRSPLDATLVYASRGWPAFPCHSPAPGPAGCTCGQAGCSSPGKHPRIAGGLRSATTDEAQLRQWWQQWPRANVAVRTGADSGLVVLDIDPDHGGNETLERLLARHGPLPDGRTVGTGSGGRHLYFAHPGYTVRNDAGRRLGPGLDVRGDGGYVVAPPSRHASGRSYAVEAQPEVIPDLPDWLIELIRRPLHAARHSTQARVLAHPDAWTRAAVTGELERLRHAAPGTRNDTLNRIAFRLGQIVGAGRLDETSASDLLLDGALTIGLGEREALATLRSGLRAGERCPRPADCEVEIP